MYYRVAFQVNQQPTWQWRSTALTSLEALFRFLRLYSVISQDRLRVFSSATREDLNEQLVQENEGFLSNSATAAQFLYERGIGSREMTHEVSESRARTSTGTLVAADAIPSSNESSILPYSPAERSISVLESRRLELKLGAGGDHDSPYTFALPLSMPQTLAWVQLFVKVQLQALLTRLGQRLQLLTGSARDVPAHQQTLRNTIQWSYDLLDAQEQQLFCRLSVFVSGCTLEAVEAISAALDRTGQD